MLTRRILTYGALVAYFIGFSGVSPVHAADGKTINLKVQNLTQGGDASASTAKVGDVISFTMDVKNTSSQDLVNYVMKVNIADWLKVAKITDLGGGHIEGSSIVFPPILQAAGCNCTNTNTFKMKISSCDVTKPLASYEDASKSVTIECPKATSNPGQTPAPTATPGKGTAPGGTTPTTTKAPSKTSTPATNPPTGPSTTWTVLGSLLVAGVVMVGRKKVGG